jgi:hypothetical protein
MRSCKLSTDDIINVDIFRLRFHPYVHFNFILILFYEKIKERN